MNNSGDNQASPAAATTNHDHLKKPTLLLNGMSLQDGDDSADDSADDRTIDSNNGKESYHHQQHLTPSPRLPSVSDDSLLIDTKGKSFKEWMYGQHKRTLSVPDLGRLYKEWKLYQHTGLESIKPCHLQVRLYVSAPLTLDTN
jgi:hypothetical protein